MKTISSLILAILFSGTAQANVDPSKCLLGYARDPGTVDLQYWIEDCLEYATGAAPGHNAVDLMADEVPNASDLVKQQISQWAAQVYYDDSLCSNNWADRFGRTHSACDGRSSTANFRTLAQLHPSGMYQFLCRTVSTIGHCDTFAPAITTALAADSTLMCDGDDSNIRFGANNAYKNHCHTLVRAFLTRSSECQPGSTAQQCTDYVSQRVSSNDKCHSGNYEVDDCVPNNGTIGGASVGPELSGDPTNPPGGGGGDGNGDATNPPPSETPPELEAALDRAFGGMPANISGIGSGTVNAPNAVAQAPGGSAIGAAGQANVRGGIGTGRSTAQPPILPQPTRGLPGGSREGGAAGGPGGGGAAGGAGGGVAGAGGLGGQGGGGGAVGNRPRGSGASRYKSIVDDMNKGFMATDIGGTAGGPAATVAPSAVDQRIEKAIAQNQNNPNLDPSRLQKALDDRLNQLGVSQQMMLKSSYFPDHQEVYIWLHQRSDLLDERGQ